MNFEVASRDSFTDPVDSFTSVNAGVVLAKTGNVKQNVTEVKSAPNSSS